MLLKKLIQLKHVALKLIKVELDLINFQITSVFTKNLRVNDLEIISHIVSDLYSLLECIKD